MTDHRPREIVHDHIATYHECQADDWPGTSLVALVCDCSSD